MYEKSNTSDIKNFINDFGKLVKILRSENLHKQDSLASAIGISTRQLSDIENGKTNCKLSTIYKICTAFDLTLDDFFKKLKELDEKI